MLSVLAQHRVCPGVTPQPHPGAGTAPGWDVLLEPAMRAVPSASRARRGCSAAPLAPLTLPPQPWHLGSGAACGPATPSPGTAAAAPRPNYCWVSQRTLKSKEESCEEGHFSGSFSLLSPPPSPRRKLEKQSPQSRIERVTETG